MGRSEQISQDLVKDWMHVVGKGEEVVSTVMTNFRLEPLVGGRVVAETEGQEEEQPGTTMATWNTVSLGDVRVELSSG